MTEEEVYDLVIVGGGVVGCADFFQASLSPRIRRAALLEKYEAVAQVNSNVLANAETLHEGAKETNYNLEQALKMQRRAKYLIGYLRERCSDREGVYIRIPSMVIGINLQERKLLEDRHRLLKPYYPDLELINWERIAGIEPKVVEGRSEGEKRNLIALHSMGYAVDYGKLAQSFVREASKEATARGKEFNTFFRTKVSDIRCTHVGSYLVNTDRGAFRTKALIVCAGPYSLMLAKKLGVPEAERYAILPVAGNFYYTTEKFLNGKVYRPQDPYIPFAKVHADRSVYDPCETRFGPTAIITPWFEKYHLSTAIDFMKMGLLTPVDYMATVVKILADPKLRGFELRSAIYNIPLGGKHAFTRWEAQKIIPTITSRDLRVGRGMGGIRPQLLDLKTKTLVMGLGKFVGERSIFNVTPSPGASNCKGNAVEDIEMVTMWLEQWEKQHERKEIGK